MTWPCWRHQLYSVKISHHTTGHAIYECVGLFANIIPNYIDLALLRLSSDQVTEMVREHLQKKHSVLWLHR